MGNREHTDETKHQYWIDKELSKKFDLKLKNEGYKNRSDWYREQVRMFINKK